MGQSEIYLRGRSSMTIGKGCRNEWQRETIVDLWQFASFDLHFYVNFDLPLPEF